MQLGNYVIVKSDDRNGKLVQYVMENVMGKEYVNGICNGKVLIAHNVNFRNFRDFKNIPNFFR